MKPISLSAVVATALACLAPSPSIASQLGDQWSDLPSATQQLVLDNIAGAQLPPGLAPVSPAQESLDSLSNLKKLVRKGERQHKLGFVEADPLAISYCHNTNTALCLNGRFIVVASWNNPFDPFGAFDAGAIQLTPASGVMWFLDPTNFELVVKVLNGCFTGPFSHWVFGAGLTNFEVAIVVFDAATGISRTYINPGGQTFAPILDQQTPFPCP